MLCINTGTSGPHKNKASWCFPREGVLINLCTQYFVKVNFSLHNIRRKEEAIEHRNLDKLVFTTLTYEDRTDQIVIRFSQYLGFFYVLFYTFFFPLSFVTASYYNLSSRTSLQRTPTGPGLSVPWGGVCPFAGVPSATCILMVDTLQGKFTKNLTYGDLWGTNHRLTAKKGVHQFRFFLSPMRTPKLRRICNRKNVWD